MTLEPAADPTDSTPPQPHYPDGQRVTGTTPLNAWMEQQLFFILVVFMGCGWFAAESLAPQKHLVPWLLGGIMLVTSLRSSVADLFQAFRRPGTILFCLAVLHLVLPFPARILGDLVFSGQPELLAGLILTTAIPIGVTSVMWTGIAKGDVALALSALTMDTLLSPFILPGVLYLFAGKAVGFNAGRLMFDLVLMVVLPAIGGILLHEASDGKLANRVLWFAGPLAKLSLGLVLAINLANSKQALFRLPFPLWHVLVTVFLLVLAGFLTGALAARLGGIRQSGVIVFANAAGIRNLSAGIVICMRSFPPLTALPVLLGIFFQQPLAALFNRWLFPRGKSFPEGLFPLE